MSEKNNKKFIEFFKKFFQKIKPRFSFHYVAYTILFTIIVFSVISVVSATTPNPGHPWAEVGDGVFNVTNNQTATRTYTFPDANATVLTTNAAVTVAQGGTGLGTIADKTLLVTTAANTLSALVIPAGQSIRRNAGDTAFEAFTPGSGTVTAVSVATANGISGSSSGGTTPALTLSLGAITPSTVNGLTLTSNATGFSVAGGTTSKSLTVSNSLTLAGTDATVMTFPSTSAAIARTDAAQTFTGTQTFSSTISGSVSGSAATLTNTRAINGVNFDGSAAITVPVNNANDVATATAVYPLWTATAGGNYAAKVSTTALSFVPSTGILSATGFSGSGASLTSLTAGNLSGTIPSGILGNSTVNIGTTAVALNRASGALVLTGITSIDGSAASATKATNLVGGNSTTLLGSIPYQSNTDTTTLLSPNTTATKKFFRMTGTGTNGAAPAWDTLVDSDIPATLTGKSINGVTLSTSGGATNFLAGDGTYKAVSGGMVYPGSGIPNSTGSAWGTSYSTIGSGTVLALATTPTFTTSITTPLILGGSTTTSPLTFQTTSATGASGASIHFKVGDNGSLEPLTISNEGRVGINTLSPVAGYALDVNVGTDDARFYGNGPGGLGFVLEDTYTGGHAWYFNTSPVDGAFGIGHAGATGSVSLPAPRALTILPNGNVGIGTAITTPTASFQIEAGTATAGTAPLKFTAGTNLGTTEAGAVEYDGTHLYFTAANGGTRYQLDQQSSGGMVYPGSGIPNSTGSAWGTSYSTIGSGTVLALATTPTFTTSITTPLILGGSTTTSPLTFQTTSGVGTTGADMHFKVGNAGGTEAMTILNNGNVGIGSTGPTARLQLPAGTSTAGTAPLKLTSGINLGTTEAGAVEYDGTHLYFTAVNAGTRYQLDQQPDTSTLQSAYGLGNTILATTGRNLIVNNIAGTQTVFGMNTGVAPTVDMVNIANTTGITTAGVSGLQITYTGGAAAVESSAQRIDLTGGTTGGAGAIWNGLRIVQGTITPVTTVQDVKLETAAFTQTVAGTTNINGLNIATAGALSNTTTAGVISYSGLNVTTPVVTTGVSGASIESDGIEINQSAYNVNFTNANALGVNGLDIIGGTIATAAGQNGTINGIRLTTAALTQTTTGISRISGLSLGTAGALVQNTGAGTINWKGLAIQMPAITQTTGTINSTGLEITTAAVTTGGNAQAINVIDNLGNSIFSVKDTTTGDNNFGAIVTSGAFIDNTSIFDEEFMSNKNVTTVTAATANLGDTTAMYYAPTTTTVTYSTPTSVTNGVARFNLPATSGTGFVFANGHGTAAYSGIYLKANLPVVQIKLKPSLVAITEDTRWGLIAVATAASGTNDASPTDGIYFSNENSTTSWVGVVRSGSANVGTVTCPGTISTTQFAVGRIVVETSSSVHFYMDYDASNGINFTDCGTVAVSTSPTAALTLGIMNAHTVATASTIDVDYMRTWQDDAKTVDNSPLVVEQAPVEPLFNAKTVLADLMTSLDPEVVKGKYADRIDTGRLVAGVEMVTPRLTADTISVNNIDTQVAFSLPPIFNKDTAGFAVIKQGDRRVRVTYDTPYISEPSVSASLVFNIADNITDMLANSMFDNKVDSMVVNNSNNGFTILINKNAPRDLRFSWNAFAVSDAKIFESVIDGLVIEAPVQAPSTNTNTTPASSSSTNTTPSNDSNTTSTTTTPSSGSTTDSTTNTTPASSSDTTPTTTIDSLLAPVPEPVVAPIQTTDQSAPATTPTTTVPISTPVPVQAPVTDTTSSAPAPVETAPATSSVSQ